MNLLFSRMVGFQSLVTFFYQIIDSECAIYISETFVKNLISNKLILVHKSQKLIQQCKYMLFFSYIQILLN